MCIINEWKKLKPITDIIQIKNYIGNILCFGYTTPNDIRYGWMAKIIDCNIYIPNININDLDILNADKFDISDLAFRCSDICNMVNSNIILNIENITYDEFGEFDGQLFIAEPSKELLEFYNKVVNIKLS